MENFDDIFWDNKITNATRPNNFINLLVKKIGQFLLMVIDMNLSGKKIHKQENTLGFRRK